MVVTKCNAFCYNHFLFYHYQKHFELFIKAIDKAK